MYQSSHSFICVGIACKEELMKKVKPTNWDCVKCGADCSFGVFAIIKGETYCLKCFRKFSKKHR